MPKQIIPNNKQFQQPNDGDAFGNVFASYGMDFYENKGRARVSRSLTAVIDQDDDLGTGDNQFSDYAAAILTDGSRYFAIGDRAFRTATSGQLTSSANWSLDEVSGNPSPGNTVTDATYFDGLLLVRDGDDILSWNGSAWANWWRTTRGQSALATGKREFLQVGSDGNLYITDGANKLYKVLSNGSGTGAITLTTDNPPDGTLDFSATDYTFTCIETTSNRLWIGFSQPNGEGGVIEWDMSATSSTANRIHKLEAIPRCMPIWQDTPIVIMQNGEVRYFNGSQFATYQNVRLPKIFDRLDEDFVHPNGWDIVDGLPHILIQGRISTDGTVYTESTQTPWYFPSAVYCLDPSVGLYPRYLLTNGKATEDDFAQPSVRAVGALTAFNTNDGYATSFLCSYTTYDETKTSHAVLAYMDRNNTRDTKAFLALRPIEDLDGYKNIEIIHKKLDSGNKIRVFYKQFEEDPIYVDGVWDTTTTFNSTGSVTGVSVGDIAWVKHGNGAGQFLRISKIETGTTNVITFQDANTFVSQNDQATIEILNFKYMGEVTGTTLDYHTFTVPSFAKSRKMTFLLEITQLAGTKNEIDYSIVET